MKRLTKQYPNGNITLDAAQFGIDQNTLDGEINNSEPIAAAVKRLAEVEDAEEKGLLVHLPCKVGDTVYKTCTVNSRIAIGSLWDGKIVETNCDRCAYRYAYCVSIGLLKHECDTMIDVINPITIVRLEQLIQIMPYINEHYFLTPEEAQQALKARADK